MGGEINIARCVPVNIASSRRVIYNYKYVVFESIKLLFVTKILCFKYLKDRNYVLNIFLAKHFYKSKLRPAYNYHFSAQCVYV